MAARYGIVTILQECDVCAKAAAWALHLLVEVGEGRKVRPGNKQGMRRRSARV